MWIIYHPSVIIKPYSLHCSSAAAAADVYFFSLISRDAHCFPLYFRVQLIHPGLDSKCTYTHNHFAITDRARGACVCLFAFEMCGLLRAHPSIRSWANSVWVLYMYLTRSQDIYKNNGTPRPISFSRSLLEAHRYTAHGRAETKCVLHRIPAQLVLFFLNIYLLCLERNVSMMLPPPLLLRSLIHARCHHFQCGKISWTFPIRGKCQ